MTALDVPPSSTSAAEPLVTNLTGLACRECGQTEPVAASHVCDMCFGPLEVVYDTEAIRKVISRERIESGPESLWRYGDLLPTLSTDPSHRVYLRAGWQPLRPAPRLAAEIGLDELWIKDDTHNPSGSFKDRVVTIAMSAARALGIQTIACASTGNLANSVAAHAAATGMEAYVFIPHDLEQGKIVASSVYGANVVAVKGNYDDVNRLCAEVADEKGWGFVNVNLRVFYAEGSKTIGFEIAEQLGWQLPDRVIAPIASGAMMVKIDKAFREFVDYGLVDDHAVKISGAQADGCSPVATAFSEGTFDVRPVKPDTIAKSLAIGNPADGYYALKVAERTGGAITSVSDEDILEGMRLLARTEGVFAETAGGVTIANLVKQVREGTIARNERTVAVISGNGYKTVESLAASCGPTMTVTPALADFTSHLEA